MSTAADVMTEYPYGPGPHKESDTNLNQLQVSNEILNMQLYIDAKQTPQQVAEGYLQQQRVILEYIEE